MSETFAVLCSKRHHGALAPGGEAKAIRRAR